MTNNDWSHEETSDPGYADQRNFYEVDPKPEVSSSSQASFYPHAIPYTQDAPYQSIRWSGRGTPYCLIAGDHKRGQSRYRLWKSKSNPDRLGDGRR